MVKDGSGPIHELRKEVNQLLPLIFVLQISVRNIWAILKPQDAVEMSRAPELPFITAPIIHDLQPRNILDDIEKQANAMVKKCGTYMWKVYHVIHSTSMSSFPLECADI